MRHRYETDAYPLSNQNGLADLSIFGIGSKLLTKARDILLEAKPDDVTAKVRQLVRQYGKPIEADAKEKWDAGLITERQYRVIAEQSVREDKDVGLA